MKRLIQLLLLLAPLVGHAQQLKIYCDHNGSVACTTASPGTPVSKWDPLWLNGGKTNVNFTQLYGMFGNGTSLQTTGTASAADLGKVLNVTGLMLGNGLAAPTAYGGSSCGANLFATSTNGSGALTCTAAAQLGVAQSWSAAQTFPVADFLITGLTTAVGTGFVCWSSSTTQLSVESTPTCNSFSPASTASPTFTGTVTAATLTATTLEQGGTPVQQLPTIQDTISATTYTLVATDCGRTKYLTSGSATTITVPSSTLAVGCIVVLVMDGAASTLTGSGLTLQMAGTTTTGNRAVVNGGMATLQFVSNTKAFAGGPGVT